MLNQLIKKVLLEATSDSSGGRGSYLSPLQPGVRKFSEESLQPFTTPVSKYINVESKNKIKKMENNKNKTSVRKKSIVPITTLKEWIEIKKDTVVVGEKKVIKLNESDILRMVKRLLSEQSVPKGKVINLFCQNDIIDSSFREHRLTFSSEEDKFGGLNSGGFKRLHLTPSSDIPRETYEPSDIILDIIPADKMDKTFLEKSKMDDKLDQKIYFIGYRTNHKYFCSVDAGTDKEWADYLNSL
jgi:hypothetical protein